MLGEEEFMLGADKMLKQKATFLAVLLVAASPSIANSASQTSTPDASAPNISALEIIQLAQSTEATALTTKPKGPAKKLRDPSDFIAIEDEALEIDTSEIVDGDGLGSIQLQWQISDNGDDWVLMPGAITANFTPRDAQVGKFLRVQVSYIDGQGNPEMLLSPRSQAVENVNDKPVGKPILNGDAREGSEFSVDTSRISDEDGIGAFSFTWERSSTRTDWQPITELLDDRMRLEQADVGFSYRAIISYIDRFGTKETLLTQASEMVANVDDPLEGAVTISGDAIEGNQLISSTSALSDYDGIASILQFWESSSDGRTWDILEFANGQNRLILNQALVGLKLRTRVNVIDNFGVETVVTSKSTTAVLNVNNEPAGTLLIRRFGS